MLSTRTLTSRGLSGLGKLSCTPAQHTEMLVVFSSLGGAVVLGGAAQGGGRNMELTKEEACKGGNK